MKLYYIHDPMCSWCWAFHPIYLQLQEKLPQEIQIVRLLGGLAPDCEQAMPTDTKRYVIGQWQKIQREVPNIEFNFDFWTHCQPRRSTYPACRAVIAARQQGDHFDELMTYAIQQAYYLQAKNPSDYATLIELAAQIGCDKVIFEKNLNAHKTHKVLQQELAKIKQFNVYSFPSLLISNNNYTQTIPTDYHQADSILSVIKKLLK